MNRFRRSATVAEKIDLGCYRDPMTGCWLWLGAQNDAGYGLLRDASGKRVRAHRASYLALVGPIPDGLVLDHLCRTPLCVNPRHLEAVTQKINNERGASITAACGRKTHCPSGHPYDERNTLFFVRKNGATDRLCRTCRRGHALAYYYRKVSPICRPLTVPAVPLPEATDEG